jgi:nucleoside-diphosphate-sugar epimerase
VVVTGAGGWLGRATLEMLESSLGPRFSSRVHAFASYRRLMKLRSGTELEVLSLNDLQRLKIGPHIVAHYAYGTREFVSQLGFATYIARNEEISTLMASHFDRQPPVGALVISSGAVYLGSDISTNPYGVMKERDERLFLNLVNNSSGSGQATRLVIPRLFNLAGPFLNKPDYVLGSIIHDIGRGGPIRLRATHPVVRSYIHVKDLVDLAFSAMLGEGPIPDRAFDTAGECKVEVGQLAELAISVLSPMGVEIVRPPLDGAPADCYVGDPAVIDSLAHSYGIELQPLARQIEDTARFLNADIA